MRRYLAILACLMFCCHSRAQNDSLSYRLTPFVKGGLTIGFFEGKASNSSSVGHTGFHLEAGIQVPIRRGRFFNWCLIPSLRFITKGDTWELDDGERAFANMQYIEVPIDYAAQISTRKCKIWFGAGLYMGYGIGGRLYGSDNLYIYHGYRLKEEPAIFGSEVRANRWDSGLNLMGAVQLRHLYLSFDLDIGLTKVASGRLDGNNDSSDVAISMSIGYTF